MKKKLNYLITFCILITINTTNIVYANTDTLHKQEKINVIEPYGPKVEDLKSKENIIKNLNEIKRIRGNLTSIRITQNLTQDELKNIYNRLDLYINEFDQIKKNLDNDIIKYSDSFSDTFFSEQILFIAQSYIISLKQQQNLIIALQTKKVSSENLFYSSYLIPVYYYLTLGDQMVSYINTYFVIT